MEEGRRAVEEGRRAAEEGRRHIQTIYQDSRIIYSKTKCKEDLRREGIFSAVGTNMINGRNRAYIYNHDIIETLNIRSEILRVAIIR